MHRRNCKLTPIIARLDHVFSKLQISNIVQKVTKYSGPDLLFFYYNSIYLLLLNGGHFLQRQGAMFFIS